jgi:hypothetical protein
MRIKPRTTSLTAEECVSRMQTAALPPLPEPRRMASRPVSWIADTMAEGAALPVTEMSCALRSAETSLIPFGSCQSCESWMLEHPTELTVQFVERCRDRFNTCLTTQRDSKRGLELWNHGVGIMCCSEFGQIDWCVLYLSMSKDMVCMVGCSWFVMRAPKPKPRAPHLSAARKCPRPGPIGTFEVAPQRSATICCWRIHTNYHSYKDNTTRQAESARHIAHLNFLPNHPCALQGNHSHHHVSIRRKGTYHSRLIAT